ncbi:MAG TPA: ATP-binding cassette domain-containing protein [Polyangiaceae bacterium]|nr:ATP-binding cassette domain-containing protein [Polyangiaceae bacterium]
MTAAERSSRGSEVSGEPALFALRGVGVERGGRAVLHDVTLELPRARLTSIVGPSGAGKTSLLRLLDRLDDPCTGTIDFAGQPLVAHAVRALRRRVAFVFQTPALFAGSVADNLRVAAELGGLGAEVAELESVLRAVGIDPGDAERDAAQLSGGEQQRVGIGRALMTRPEVLLLDEPTSALDPEAAQRLLGTVQRLAAQRGLSVIMVTHRLSEARQYSEHCVMLEAGRLVEAGSTAAMFASATTARARAYLASSE